MPPKSRDLTGALSFYERRWGSWGLAMVLSLPLATGCSEKPPTPAPSNTVTLQANAADDARRKLSSAIQRVQPDSMATQTKRETVVNAVNSWLASGPESEVERLKVSEKNAALLSPSALRIASAVRFTENDVIYIRDCLILKSLTESVWKQADAMASGGVATDTQRVVQLFQHLIRNVSLLRADEVRVPVGLYESMLLGRGTVDDRMWAFAEALRQRQLDAVILRPSTPGDPAAVDPIAAADVLIGVIVDSRLLLFDPIRGAVVPKADDRNPLVTDPAGLETLLPHERWKTSTVLTVCHPSAFAPRMLILQQRLEADDSAVLYEELAGGTSEIHPLLDRISEVIGNVWPRDSMKIWEVPEQRIAAAASLTEEQRQAYTLLMRPLDSPFERESLSVGNLQTDPTIDESKLSIEEKMSLKVAALQKLLNRSDDLFGKPSKRLLSARIQQIMGNNDVGMIQDLQQIRIASLQERIELELPVDDKKPMVVPFKLPKTILDVQRNAVGDTLYWTSMTQMSRNEMGATVATLRNYRRQYPEEKYVYSALLNEAEALLTLKDLTNAARTLEEADTEQNPERLRTLWLRSRLAASVPAAQEPVSPAAEVPAAEEAAEGSPIDPTVAPEIEAAADEDSSTQPEPSSEPGSKPVP